jgi:CheY-like chemotaxis protein
MTNILIVDDTDVDLLLMERLLSATEFTIVTAGDGLQALEKLKTWNIDVILTDLQMPKMNGLELVRKVREQRLNVPVILTTGQGSEEIAAEALQSGASGYIPKNKLHQMLLSTIEGILDLINSERSYDRLIRFSKGSRFKFELDSDPTLIKEVVDFCERMLHSMSTLDRIGRLRIAIAIDQALHNALYRGNLEIDRHHKIGFNDEASEVVSSRLESSKYRDRKIRVAIEIKPTRFGICIQDDGRGFDPKTVGSWKEPSLRGTILMKSFMDSVSYNDKGNMVEMHSYFGEPRPHPTAETAAEKLPARIINNTTHKVTQLILPKMVVGRRTGCHLKLNSEKVAPLHCSLNFDQGNWALINLTNKYTTLRNGNPVKGSQLQSGDLITIGDQEFTFEAG